MCYDGKHRTKILFEQENVLMCFFNIFLILDPLSAKAVNISTRIKLS